MTFWIILILVVAVLLILGVDRLLARFGVCPVRPEETRTGVTQLTSGVERWAERRTRVAAARKRKDGDAASQRDAQNS